MGNFPGGKAFAFSIFDDTDNGTLQNIGPVYRVLSELGIVTTKSVWPLATDHRQRIVGESLQDTEYLPFICDLLDQGFEIALHNVQNTDATRETTKRGFDEFYRQLSVYPRTHCNHVSNRENIYWGSERLSSTSLKLAYNIATRFRRHHYFEGHVPGSPYFWGDICHDRISYVRNFVFDDINLARINPSMPYHDPRKPYVQYWFSSSQGSTVELFCKMISEENQDRLEAEEGVCIMYTHFASRFVIDGKLDSNFERLITRLAKKNGWFVPVATLLDYLQKRKQTSGIACRELARMERLWFLSKVRRGTN